jgi:hypothetical protein
MAAARQTTENRQFINERHYAATLCYANHFGTFDLSSRLLNTGRWAPPESEQPELSKFTDLLMRRLLVLFMRAGQFRNPLARLHGL